MRFVNNVCKGFFYSCKLVWGCSLAGMFVAGLCLLGCGGGAANMSSNPPTSPTPSPTPAGVYDPCNGAGDYSWQGSFVSQQITLPATPLNATDAALVAGAYDPSVLPSAGYDAVILAPASATQFPGQRPAVVLAHGINGNLCSLWWLAHTLAGDGYVVVVYTNPYNETPYTLGSEIDGMVNGVNFLSSAQNPYLTRTNAADVAVGGWSEGSGTTGFAQEFPDLPQIKAAMMFDNLKEWAEGDPGAHQYCLPPQQLQNTPRVPALGFASDAPCTELPTVTTPTIKESGWNWWIQHGFPTVEFVMAGYVHTSFSSAGATTETSAEVSAHDQTMAAIVLPWLDAYLNGNSSSLTQILSCTINGQPANSVLSTQFQSGVNLPQSSVNTADYQTYLQTSCP